MPAAQDEGGAEAVHDVLEQRVGEVARQVGPEAFAEEGQWEGGEGEGPEEEVVCC